MRKPLRTVVLPAVVIASLFAWDHAVLSQEKPSTPVQSSASTPPPVPTQQDLVAACLTLGRVLYSTVEKNDSYNARKTIDAYDLLKSGVTDVEMLRSLDQSTTYVDGVKKSLGGYSYGGGGKIPPLSIYHYVIKPPIDPDDPESGKGLRGRRR